MKKLYSEEQWYQAGVQMAKEAQEGLAAGKTLEEMLFLSPEEALTARELYKEMGETELQAGMDGYLSRWD